MKQKITLRPATQTRPIKSTKNLNLNGGSKKTGKKSVPGAVATGYQVAKNKLNSTSKTTITNALRRRAQAIIKDRSVDAHSRAIIRYGLEVNDPWLPELVRCVDAGETIIETIVVLKRPKLTPGFGRGKTYSTVYRKDLNNPHTVRVWDCKYLST